MQPGAVVDEAFVIWNCAGLMETGMLPCLPLISLSCI